MYNNMTKEHILIQFLNIIIVIKLYIYKLYFIYRYIFIHIYIYICFRFLKLITKLQELLKISIFILIINTFKCIYTIAMLFFKF